MNFQNSSNYYERLGISKNSTKEEIRTAFRRVALHDHPDKNPNNPTAVESFQSASEAYSILRDEITRCYYDAYGDEGVREYYRLFFGPSFMKSYADMGDNFRIPKQCPKIQVVNVKCMLHELFNGCTKQLKLTSNSKHVNMCIELEILKGSEDGTEISIPPNLSNMDIKFVVRQIPNVKYQRKGADLYYQLDINYLDAALKRQISIPLMDGRKYKYIPPKVSSDTMYRITNEGMPTLHNLSQRGDLYIKYNITFPDIHNIEYMKKLEELSFIPP